MKDVNAPFLPYRLQFLAAIAQVILVLGLAKVYSNIDIVPVEFRFERYGPTFLVCGALLCLPVLVHIAQKISEAWRAQEGRELPGGQSPAAPPREASQEARERIGPSFARSIRNDLTMVAIPLAFLIPGSLFLVFLPFGYVPGRGRWIPVTPEVVWFHLALAAPFACLAMALLVYRWSRIKTIFRTGIEVSGVVVSNKVHRITFVDTRRVDFEYEYRGRRYAAFEGFRGSPLADSLAKGLTIAVLVDPARPSKALIKTFYASAA
ncbi:MAG TPA: DUF3592 domain-containing protein [Casimicrobiaceae bacterium]|nr:DUF3592 domain-containing protein [Casimicrobiaceae bacterium]